MEGLRKFDKLVYFNGVKFKRCKVNEGSIRYICASCQKVSITVNNDGSIKKAKDISHKNAKCVKISETEYECLVECLFLIKLLK